LFQHVLDQFEGTMIHLGDFSDHPEEPCWFCGHVVEYPNPNDDYHFRYQADAFGELMLLLDMLQKDSPSRHVIFLTDYQLGPDNPEVVSLKDLEAFRRLNCDGKIRFNTLYHIKSETA